MSARAVVAAVVTSDTREMTLEAWSDVDEDEPCELVDGRLVEEEMPSILHEAAVSWLIALLWWSLDSGTAKPQ